MKLKNCEKEILIEFGHSEEDLEQIQEALDSRYTKYEYCCGGSEKKISRQKACELLGIREFLSGISRSAFHWSAVRYIDDNCEEKGYIYFDSSNLFKQK